VYACSSPPIFLSTPPLLLRTPHLLSLLSLLALALPALALLAIAPLPHSCGNSFIPQILDTTIFVIYIAEHNTECFATKKFGGGTQLMHQWGFLFVAAIEPARQWST
jgi:hypothetical protein